MDTIEILNINSWEGPFSKEEQDRAIKALENGKVVFLPHLPFALETHELAFLSPDKTDPKSKNISFDIHRDKLGGTLCEGEEALQLKSMVKRYAIQSRSLLNTLFPHYNPSIRQGRTSFRPVEIAGRKSSYRKDDTLLHVDSFPATPVKGERIMRVFTNVNPKGKPRVWRLGEPFPDVVQKMGHRLKKPIPGLAHLLKLLKITKDHRSLYDHYMLQLHDLMKGDPEYQKHVPQQEFHFPANTSWIVYTDQVSHAAMAGQHVFEQTYYLPAVGNKFLETTPLRVLEKYIGRKLT